MSGENVEIVLGRQRKPLCEGNRKLQIPSASSTSLSLASITEASSFQVCELR